MPRRDLEGTLKQIRDRGEAITDLVVSDYFPSMPNLGTVEAPDGSGVISSASPEVIPISGGEIQERRRGRGSLALTARLNSLCRETVNAYNVLEDYLKERLTDSHRPDATRLAEHSRDILTRATGEISQLRGAFLERNAQGRTLALNLSTLRNAQQEKRSVVVVSEAPPEPKTAEEILRTMLEKTDALHQSVEPIRALKEQLDKIRQDSTTDQGVKDALDSPFDALEALLRESDATPFKKQVSSMQALQLLMKDPTRMTSSELEGFKQLVTHHKDQILENAVSYLASPPEPPERVPAVPGPASAPAQETLAYLQGRLQDGGRITQVFEQAVALIQVAKRVVPADSPAGKLLEKLSSRLDEFQQKRKELSAWVSAFTQERSGDGITLQQALQNAIQPLANEAQDGHRGPIATEIEQQKHLAKLEEAYKEYHLARQAALIRRVRSRDGFICAADTHEALDLWDKSWEKDSWGPLKVGVRYDFHYEASGQPGFTARMGTIPKVASLWLTQDGLLHIELPEIKWNIFGKKQAEALVNLLQHKIMLSEEKPRYFELGGGKSSAKAMLAIAEECTKQGIRFVFKAGYLDQLTPEDQKYRERLEKLQERNQQQLGNPPAASQPGQRGPVTRQSI